MLHTTSISSGNPSILGVFEESEVYDDPEFIEILDIYMTKSSYTVWFYVYSAEDVNFIREHSHYHHLSLKGCINTLAKTDSAQSPTLYYYKDGNTTELGRVGVIHQWLCG